jgi:PAS domain S-box-containing protein
MRKLSLLSRSEPSAALSYGLAIMSVVVALIIAWWIEAVWRSAPHASLFLCAVMFSAWFGGIKPGLVATVLSLLTFNYFFLAPIHSLAVDVTQLPRLIIFAVSALLVGSLSAAQRRGAESLRRARDELQDTLVKLQRTNESLNVENVERIRTEETLREQANLLDLTHDTVFVRDMNDVITYWNRGARTLYGWTNEEAVGTVAHQLLHTRFPEPLEEITEQLVRTGRWEGELVHTKRDGTQVIVASRWALQRGDARRPLAILETNNDITERRRAEEERRQLLVREQSANAEALAAQHRFLDLVNSIEGIVWEADPQTFRFLFVSAQARRVLGYPAERWLTEPTFWKEHIHPDDREWAVNFCVAATAEKRDHEFEYRMLAADGRTVWLRDLVTVVAEGDRATRLRGVMLDITERKRAEVVLRESERRYRNIFETAGVSIWEEDFSQVKAVIDELKAQGIRDFRGFLATNPEFVDRAVTMVKIVDVNDVSVELFAAESKAELLVSLHKVFVPETRDVFVEELIAIAEGRTSFEAETVVQTLTGERLTVLFTIAFPPPRARFDSVLVTLTDITERKRAEYLTRQVFESAPDGVYVIGRDYRFQRVNPVYGQLWGMPPQRIVAMHIAELLGMDAFEHTIKPNLDRCFAGEDVNFAGWFVYPLGRRYMAVSYSPLRPDSQRVEAVLMIGRNLTEHMQASEALQQAQAELAHVTRVTTLGELAASIAHEVNQPLAAVVADANACLNWLAADNPDLGLVRLALDAIVKDGHRAGDVIHRIRQLATKTAPQKAQLEINDVIRDVVPLVRTEVLSHQVSLFVDPAAGLPPILGDRIQLQQVLINLVMNGVEAMASVGDRPRELAIRSRLHEGDQILVAVQDVGVGIDSNKADQLFSAFFTSKPGGMGIGLSISRSIIEAHGGRLWVTGNDGPGATFQFALPGYRA